MKVEFAFEIDEIVITPLGDKGIVAMLGYDKSGPQVYVNTSSGGDRWWNQEQINKTN